MSRFPAVLLSLSGSVVACSADPGADLDGPQVVASSLTRPRTVELSVQPTIEIQFSEPIDSASVHAGSIAIVGWKDVGRCDLAPVCQRGSCERGRCQEDPLTASARSKIDAGKYVSDELLEWSLSSSPSGPDTLLRINPARPLRPHARHTIVVGAAVRDVSGAPLVDASGVRAGWSRDFVTAGAGSSGPEPRLVRPRPSEGYVPTNLAEILVSFPAPVLIDPGGELFLESDIGNLVGLVDPRPCADWLGGFCLRFSPAAPLAAETHYRVLGGTVSDRWGNLAITAREPTWFRTGSGPDLTPPDANRITVTMMGRCVVARYRDGEVVELSLTVADQTRRASGVAPEVGIRIEDGSIGAGDLVDAVIEVVDRAGNTVRFDETVVAGSGFDPELPRLIITEVLANPLGPEPDAEFVEIASPTGEAVLVRGARLVDLPWPEIEAMLALGEPPPGDLLADFELPAGAVAILVGSGWVAGEGGDPVPAPGTIVIAAESSLARSGLKNSGEPLTLYGVEPAAPIATYGNFIDPGASAHAGRSVVVLDPQSCDLADSWVSEPSGRSTPGRLPWGGS